MERPTNIVEALRSERVVVNLLAQDSRQRLFGSLLRASRAIKAWEDGEGLHARLDDLFGFMDQNFEKMNHDECKRFLRGDRSITENGMPLFIAKHILRSLRIDMSEVPNFRRWAQKQEILSQ